MSHSVDSQTSPQSACPRRLGTHRRSPQSEQFQQTMALSQEAQNQSFELAQQGFSLEEAAQQLTAQGMDQQDAQFMASLG